MKNQKTRKKRQFNAMKHGAFAIELFILDEDRNEFEDLHAGLVAEFKPSGRMEQEIILDIAKLHWRKRRIERFYVNEADLLQLHPGEEALPRLITISKTMTKDVPCRDVWKVLSSLPRPIFDAVRANFKLPIQELDPDWIERLKKFVLSLYWATDRMVSDQKKDPRFVGETAAKLAELTGKRMEAEERIDAAIDRLLRRYAQLKTFKEVMAVKENEAPRKLAG